MFRLSAEPIVLPELNQDAAGGYVTFDGRVRNHNEGKAVLRLEYEAYALLAEVEGNRILDEARSMFGLLDAQAIHRVGTLEIGESAVWIGVAAAHRAEAFRACSYVIDEIKRRVPIWKKEHYAEGSSEWIGCHEGKSEVGSQKSEVGGGEFYRRQIALPEVGEEGQAKLAAARVLMVGAGGLGCAALPYLAAAGIGTIGICDGDTVDVSNLHRQVLFDFGDQGKAKAQIAAQRLKNLNPTIEVIAIDAYLDQTNTHILDAYDIVVDGTDRFAAKFLLNDACVKAGKPLVTASLHRFEGQIMVVDPAGGCMRCLWPTAPYDGCVGTCAETGVLGATPGIFGLLQANEVLKLILGFAEALCGDLLTVDLRTYETMRLKRTPRADCPSCGKGQMDSPIDIDWSQAAGMSLVDIRELYEGETVPGAARIPRAMGEISGRVCLICAAGARSARAARELRARGIEAYSLIGGVQSIPGYSK